MRDFPHIKQAIAPLALRYFQMAMSLLDSGLYYRHSNQ
jgi:hypothetical protein